MIEIRKTLTFSDWMAGLRDHRARAKIAARIDRLALHNPGDVEPVGEGISELRITMAQVIGFISCSEVWR
jgi:putative addiction module killer protein